MMNVSIDGAVCLLILCCGMTGIIGSGLGYWRAQKKYIPEIIEANETIARLKLLDLLRGDE